MVTCDLWANRPTGQQANDVPPALMIDWRMQDVAATKRQAVRQQVW